MFASGIVLLLLGVFALGLSATANFDYPVILANADVSRGGAAWEVSAPFSKGDYLVADFRIHPGWANQPYEFSEYFQGVNFKIIWLEVYPPDGGNFTRFAAALAIDRERLQPVGYLAITLLDRGTGLTVNNVSEVGGLPAWVINQTIGGLPIEELPSPWAVGGIAKQDGIYTLRIAGPYPPPILDPGEHIQPPDYVALGVRPLNRPFLILLPVGGALIVAAVVLVVWSRKGPKERNH